MYQFGLQFDMRAPDFGTPRDKIYAECIKMCEWVDTRGFTQVNLMEHHGVEDGYLPAPFVMAGAVGARTKNVKILLGAVLLPLHDPVKVAEQTAVADIISGGRVVVCLGAGYVESEFAMFRRSTKDRGKLLDEGVPIILRALSGERFVAGGREVFIRPLPLQKPNACVVIGGGAPVVVKRAVRNGLGMMPMHPGLVPVYMEECAKAGMKPGPMYVGMGTVHVSEDPDRTWAQIMPHVMHLVRSYAKFAEGAESSSPFEGVTTKEQVEKLGIYRVITPDQAVELSEKAAPLGGCVSLHPLIGGLDPKIGWENIELLVNKVMPRLKKKVA